MTTPKLLKPPPPDRTKLAIIAVDPGPGCGIAAYHPYPGAEGYNFDTYTLELGDEGHSWLEATLVGLIENLRYFMRDDPATNSVLTTEGVVLICEKFEYRKDDVENRDRINYMAAEYVGVCKFVGQTHEDEVVSFVMQGASEAKGFWVNDKIHRLGLHGSTRHEMDALRHLLKFMTFNLNQDWLLHALKKEV